MSFGFIYRAPEKEDYRDKGPVRLGGVPLVSSGQWDNYSPMNELQDRGLSTMACTSYGTLSAIEFLENCLYGDKTNWSDRFLACLSGTSQYGNDPHTVAETLRKKGTVYETDWPYPEIKTWGEFYRQPPFDLEVEAQVKFKGKYDFAHQYVGTDPQSMKNALQYSPLGVDVFAWGRQDENGIFYRDGNKSNHWCVCYGYNPNRYWKIYDSYSNEHKLLDWQFGFTMVKQYTLDKQVLKNDLWSKAIRWLAERMGVVFS